jgi:hypothetical protein
MRMAWDLNKRDGKAINLEIDEGRYKETLAKFSES